MKQLSVFFAALILLFASVGCSKPKSPQYVSYGNFRLEKLGLGTTILGTDVRIYNPNPYALKLKSASLDVYFNDRFLGHTSVDSLITLPGLDTSAIHLRMNASAKDILASTAQLLLNPDVKIKITGTARAGRGKFFITVPIDYEGIQRIEL